MNTETNKEDEIHERGTTTRLKIWETLVYPAHVWMWLVSKMLGYDLLYGDEAEEWKKEHEKSKI